MRILLSTLLMIFAVQGWAGMDDWTCNLTDGNKFAIEWAGPNTKFLLNSVPLNCSIDGVLKSAPTTSKQNSNDYRCKTKDLEQISIAKLQIDGDRAQLVFTHPEKKNGLHEIVNGTCANGAMPPGISQTSESSNAEPCFVYVNPPDGLNFLLEFNSAARTVLISGDAFPGDMIVIEQSAPPFQGNEMYKGKGNRKDFMVISKRGKNGGRYVTLASYGGAIEFEDSLCSSTNQNFFDGENL
jgi:hypothetical protein